MASNLWWSWPPAVRMIFKALDRQGWKTSGHNPVKMLKELPKDILDSAARNKDYLSLYDAVLSQFQKHLTEKKCALLAEFSGLEDHAIAYFSAEYGLHHSPAFLCRADWVFWPATTSRSAVISVFPWWPIGFMYPEGYLRQRTPRGWLAGERRPTLDRDAASISRVLGRTRQADCSAGPVY